MTIGYTAKDIQVLEGLEAVRLRPGMYIGSTDQRGLHHLVYEVVDNSVDEAMAGHCTLVDITIEQDGSVRVSDNGRGIPVDVHPTTGKSGLETVMTTLHAGRQVRRWCLQGLRRAPRSGRLCCQRPILSHAGRHQAGRAHLLSGV